MRPVPFLVSALAASACASAHPFDERYERGDYAGAAAAFMADSTLHAEARALWRLAMIHLAPGKEMHDPAKARDPLERLVELHPESPFVGPALGLLGLLEELEASREATAALGRRLAVAEEERELWLSVIAQADPAREGYDAARALEALEAWMEAHPDSRYRSATQAATGLLTELLRTRGAVAALQRQLDQLKAVDLEDPPY
ncbi:MAG: hypothetical protein ACRELC_00705 [Gemmatimonadota bacterium]